MRTTQYCFLNTHWNKISSSDLLPNCVFKPEGILWFNYINCFVKQNKSTNDWQNRVWMIMLFWWIKGKRKFILDYTLRRAIAQFQANKERCDCILFQYSFINKSKGYRLNPHHEKIISMIPILIQMLRRKFSGQLYGVWWRNIHYCATDYFQIVHSNFPLLIVLISGEILIWIAKGLLQNTESSYRCFIFIKIFKEGPEMSRFLFPGCSS